MRSRGRAGAAATRGSAPCLIDRARVGASVEQEKRHFDVAFLGDPVKGSVAHLWRRRGWAGERELERER